MKKINELLDDSGDVLLDLPDWQAGHPKPHQKDLKAIMEISESLLAFGASKKEEERRLRNKSREPFVL